MFNDFDTQVQSDELIPFWYEDYGGWDCQEWSSALHAEKQRGSSPLSSTIQELVTTD